MSSREKILARISANAPASAHTKGSVEVDICTFENPVEKFKTSLTSIGATVLEIPTLENLQEILSEKFSQASNQIIHLPGFKSTPLNLTSPHRLADVEVAVLKSELGVAENGAQWLTEKNMVDRALPFICENLWLVVEREKIFSTMHDAYREIAGSEFEYGVFIAGPSKTADIEQSLVLGAHGPKTLTVFIL